MNYKYPPIYKYGLLLLVIYMFIKHQKIMSSDKILLNSVIITLVVFIFDNVIIKDHPSLLEEMYKKKSSQSDDDYDEQDDISDNELDEIINSYDVSIDERLNRNPREIDINIQRQQPYQREYFDTNMVY
jgi:CBS-domain-containing membrane protein